MPNSTRARRRPTHPVRAELPAKQPGAALPDTRGRLVIVVCADTGRLDLVLSATRRRLSSIAALSFVEPMGTRRLPAGSGVVVTRRVLRDLERMGGITLVWQSGADRYGLPISVLARLSAGETVIVGADTDIGTEARAIWSDVSVVRLLSKTDRVRSALSLRDCFARVAGPQLAQRGRNRMRGEMLAATVQDDGDLAAAVRTLAQVLTGLAPMRAADADRADPFAFVKPSSKPSHLGGRRRLSKVTAPQGHMDVLTKQLARPREPL